MTVIGDARIRAEAHLTSTCLIVRAGEGEPTIDPVTLEAVLPPPTTVYEGPCSVSPVGVGGEGTVADRQLTGRTWIVAVPVAAVGVQRGDTVTVTVVDEHGDPDLVGVPLTVDEVVVRSRVVLRRLRCVDTRPGSARLP